MTNQLFPIRPEADDCPSCGLHELIESVGQLRLIVDELYRRIVALEGRQAQPFGDNVTVAYPPEWGETVPLLEIEYD